MPEPELPVGPDVAGQVQDTCARDAAATSRDPGFGLALILLSAVGTVTGLAIMILVNWRAGFTVLITVTLVLSLFLRWEMRRRFARRVVLASQAPANLVVTETSPL